MRRQYKVQLGQRIVISKSPCALINKAFLFLSSVVKSKGRTSYLKPKIPYQVNKSQSLSYQIWVSHRPNNLILNTNFWYESEEEEIYNEKKTGEWGTLFVNVYLNKMEFSMIFPYIHKNKNFNLLIYQT